MASRVVNLIADDLDGSEAEEIITFSLESTSYEIDLSSAHAKELRDALEPYMKAGRKTGRRRNARWAASATSRGG